MAEERRFAILIDSDNIAPKYISIILNEITNKGIITYKRIYGDWTSTSAGSWKKLLLRHSLTPVQQYSYTYGKNATDSAMIIDAMDILYTGEVDGFALCSSDSDFTRLAVRLREAGKMVVGLGESKTPAPFCAACNEFKFLDRIADDDDKEELRKKKKAETAKKKTAVRQTPKEKEVVEADIEEEKSDEETAVTPLDTIAASLKDIIIESTDDDNGIDIALLGNRLQKRHPDFDTRNYGYSKFSIFLKKFDFITMEHIATSVIVKLNAPQEDKRIENAIVEMVRKYGARGVNLGTLSSEVKNEFPDFTPKEYGFSKFEQYIRSLDALEVKNSTPLNKKVFAR
jgi:uncharacterized LabA/DUF88 family protein